MRISVTGEDESEPGIHMTSEGLGNPELAGEGSWTFVTQRQDIPPSQSQDASVPSRPWLTLGSHLQRLSIFTIWRRPREDILFSPIPCKKEFLVIDKY